MEREIYKERHFIAKRMDYDSQSLWMETGREKNKEIVRVLKCTVKTIHRSWTKQNKLIRNGISKTTLN